MPHPMPLQPLTSRFLIGQSKSGRRGSRPTTIYSPRSESTRLATNLVSKRRAPGRFHSSISLSISLPISFSISIPLSLSWPCPAASGGHGRSGHLSSLSLSPSTTNFDDTGRRPACLFSSSLSSPPMGSLAPGRAASHSLAHPHVSQGSQPGQEPGFPSKG